ncbi:MAG: hypothetical protein WCT12_25325 [Verrucomicrobiota bacterium]
METIYVETSVISYLVTDPSRDLVTAANQQVTRDWWQRRSPGTGPPLPLHRLPATDPSAPSEVVEIKVA